MCTTARKLRRGTQHGRAHVLRVRAVNQQRKAIEGRMSRMQPWSDVTGIMAMMAFLSQLKKVMGKV